MLADGGTLPVIWLGWRDVDCARHPEPEKVWPVRVQAGAFGENQPARALLISPDHAVCVDGVLVPIRNLVNGATIAQIRVWPVMSMMSLCIFCFYFRGTA